MVKKRKAKSKKIVSNLTKKPRKIKGFDWKDKLTVSKTKICPPHRIPHKLPFGKKIDYETCHIHIRKRGMAHHRPFCKIMKCKHYGYMVNEYKQYKRIKKELNKRTRSKD